ncbi:hypothetical protein HanRHA438_Chr10g0466441 [Helianthus annuus]|uniref:Transposase (putative) gypsy type domain-containing protein n=1 Tax=Helianthus annuus TaxID=4232 RepID=A0A9K3N5R8_HELAN|nr:hypothetical protein HanXRQr2_Chr10g0453611 [Helianthus annuus]KAJ0514726.1 hypothetical protein HanHA300_Chr10g0372861 [Helianthus annuus]KAJ0523001.1 hypothetical protein HanIR_Chr10g0488991 [Helianthus annuus]KAJ0530880.1 hypothetical protein HanHA89_Chr10g0394981 [Helianthus annuus]KAJ0701105.1 hypothetical protein HanOQP8_Chr10g0375751 [Helianthus annuus]
MAPGKDNLSESVSILTQRQLDKFIREYRIPLDIHLTLPSKDETIYPFRQGKFPFYTRVCNFANYRVPFSRFLIRVLQFFRVHICQVNPFGLSRINHFEVSCRAQDQRPDLEVFWYLHLCSPERAEMSLRDALKVPNFNVLDFDLDEQLEGEVPLMQQVALAAQEIRPLTSQGTSEPSAAGATSSIPKPTKGAAGSSGSQAGKGSILDDVDSDPEVRSLDEALQYRPSSGSLKDPLPMPKTKKNKKGSSHSSSDVMIELDEHLSGGKSSREEAVRARSAPTPTFSGGFLPVNEVESMEVENPIITSKGKGKAHGEPKMVTFSGTILDSSLGPDFFIDNEEDQVSSLPPSGFGPELMSFFRYADVFSDDMEIDPATADEKFVLEWDIRNKDSVMDELVAKTFLFNINTPLDHARSRKMKNQDLGAMVLSNQAQSNIYVTELYRRWVEAESVRENLEKETLSLKRKIQRTPDVEKKIAQLTQDLQAQKKKVKSLTI